MALIKYLAHKQIRHRLVELRPKLFRVALGWCGSPAHADDLVQEALARALQSLDRLQHPEALTGWVFTIMSNCYRDLCRKQNPDQLMDETPDLSASEIEHQLDLELSTRRVRRAVTQLKQPHREILVLVDLGGFSYSQAADILSLPMGTVMSRLSRARDQLKRQLLMDEKNRTNKVTYMDQKQ